MISPGLTINQEKKLRAEKAEGGPRREYFNPDMVAQLIELASTVKAYRKLKNDQSAAPMRRELLAKIDSILDRLILL